MRLFRHPRTQGSERNVLGIGNCQVESIARCAGRALGLKPAYLDLRDARTDPKLLEPAIAKSRVVFCQRRDLEPRVRELAASCGREDLVVIPVPSIFFPGFHPDVAFPSPDGERRDLPMGNANSAILLAAWRDGLSSSDAISLFCEEVYDALGYYDMFDLAKQKLVKDCALAGFDVEPLMLKWLEEGAFVHVPLHPKMKVLQDIALTQLRIHRLYDEPTFAQAPEDEFARNLIWPVYPEIARRLLLRGDYVFHPKNMRKLDRPDLAPMDLETFVSRTFECFSRSAPVLSAFLRLTDPRLDNMQRFVKSSAPSRNPYKDLAASHWWSNAVAEPLPEDVDPVAKAKFVIGSRDKVATAGSCFAQHISRRLVERGFNFLITEQAPPTCGDPIAAGYGTFTARFGNIYTVRQLLQLADRAYGLFEPGTDAWKVAGGYIDPFRPRVGEHFASMEDLRASRALHFTAVREMFETADVFVFTLGLTEAWIERKHEAVVPLPPGIFGAAVPPEAYRPRNFDVREVLADLEALVQMMSSRNPRVRILLTVSPVPLIATHGDEHVLAATTYSKSVLRAAAGETAKRHDRVDYFPSYEVITGSFSRGNYFADDLRQVTDSGVDHVMRLFLKHYAASGTASPHSSSEQRFKLEAGVAKDVVCDEEEIRGPIGQSG